jgi:soluble lytic murein transglycosylase-like protein
MKCLRLFTVVALMLALCRCAGHAPTEEADAPHDPTPVAVPDPVTKERMLPEQQAAIFDRYAQGEMTQVEEQELKKSCELHPAENPFCYIVMNRERLDAQLKQALKTPILRSNGTIKPKIVRGKVKNWVELRFSPISALIRGVATLKPTDVEKVVKLALADPHCPNNIAVAVATQKEDDLPNEKIPGVIAKLYEKGGDCLLKSPADREVLLTRAGLFYYLAKNYKAAAKVLRISSALSEVYVGRALYWLYRTETELKDAAAAKKTLATMKTRYPFSFHTLVARTANNEDPGEILTTAEMNPKLTRSQKDTAVNPLIEAVEILSQLKYRESAAKVLDFAVAESHEAEPELRIYLAELKPDEGDFRSKITLLSDVLYKNPALISKKTMELYFPKVYFPIFEKNDSGLDPYLLLSVARQESAFNPRAISSANARGLLQLAPKTGRRYQNNPPPNLMDPEVNINIASRYLQDLLKKVNGQIHFALAAYNAGENRLTTWTSRYPDSEPILFIDLIPYRETREYVASVLRNYY